MRVVSEICREHNVKLYMDACRFAENSWFIKTQETGYNEKSPLEIAKEMFSVFVGCVMSTKKDGLCNSGGFIATNDEQTYTEFSHEVILNEGFITYGGMTGRDMEAKCLVKCLKKMASPCWSPSEDTRYIWTPAKFALTSTARSFQLGR